LQVFRELHHLLAVFGRKFRHLTGQVPDVGAERSLFLLVAGEVADRALVQARELLQLQGLHLALPRLHERQRRPRDAQEGRDLVLRESQVLPGLPEPLAQRLPVLVAVVGLLVTLFAHLRTLFFWAASAASRLWLSMMSWTATSTSLYPPFLTSLSGG